MKQIIIDHFYALDQVLDNYYVQKNFNAAMFIYGVICLYGYL